MRSLPFPREMRAVKITRHWLSILSFCTVIPSVVLAQQASIHTPQLPAVVVESDIAPLSVSLHKPHNRSRSLTVTP